MNILLIGASGFIGQHLLTSLLAYGHQIIGTYRCQDLLDTPLNQKNIRFVRIDVGDMGEPERWLPYLENIDIVINSVGIIAGNHQQFTQIHDVAPKALFLACRQAKVKRVIHISALGVGHHNPTIYQRSKLAADEALQQLDLDWFILRPSLVYGKGGKSFEFFRILANLPLIVLPDQGQQTIQPVHISDLVAAILRCLDEDVPSQQIINVVGCEVISYRDWLMALRTSKLPVLKIPMPLLILTILSKLGQHFSPLFNADNLTMLQQHNTSDVTQMTAFLGRKPLGITEAL